METVGTFAASHGVNPKALRVLTKLYMSMRIYCKQNLSAVPPSSFLMLFYPFHLCDFCLPSDLGLAPESTCCCCVQNSIRGILLFFKGSLKYNLTPQLVKADCITLGKDLCGFGLSLSSCTSCRHDRSARSSNCGQMGEESAWTLGVNGTGTSVSKRVKPRTPLTALFVRLSWRTNWWTWSGSSE